MKVTKKQFNRLALTLMIGVMAPAFIHNVYGETQRISENMPQMPAGYSAEQSQAIHEAAQSSVDRRELLAQLNNRQEPAINEAQVSAQIAQDIADVEAWVERTNDSALYEEIAVGDEATNTQERWETRLKQTASKWTGFKSPGEVYQSEIPKMATLMRVILSDPSINGKLSEDMPDGRAALGMLRNQIIKETGIDASATELTVGQTVKLYRFAKYNLSKLSPVERQVLAIVS